MHKYTSPNTTDTTLYPLTFILDVLIYAVFWRGNFCLDFSHFLGVQISRPQNALAYKNYKYMRYGNSDGGDERFVNDGNDEENSVDVFYTEQIFQTKFYPRKNA